MHVSSLPITILTIAPCFCSAVRCCALFVVVVVVDVVGIVIVAAVVLRRDDQTLANEHDSVDLRQRQAEERSNI